MLIVTGDKRVFHGAAIAMSRILTPVSNLLRHRSARPMGLQLVSAGLALLCSAALVLGLTIGAVHSYVAEDHKASEIVGALDQTANHLLAVEVIARGYALFGNPDLLARYRRESASLSSALAALDALTGATPEFQASLKRVRETVTGRASAVSRAMQVKPDPPIRVALFLRAEPVAASIDAARDAVQSMREIAEARRRATAQSTEQRAVESFALAAVLTVAAVLCGALGAALALFGEKATAPQAAPSR